MVRWSRVLERVEHLVEFYHGRVVRAKDSMREAEDDMTTRQI